MGNNLNRNLSLDRYVLGGQSKAGVTLPTNCDTTKFSLGTWTACDLLTEQESSFVI